MISELQMKMLVGILRPFCAWKLSQIIQDLQISQVPLLRGNPQNEDAGQTNSSFDDSSIKASILRPFKILGLVRTSDQFHARVFEEMTMVSAGDFAFGSCFPVAPLLLHLHLRKGEECWKTERGLGGASDWWVITRKKIEGPCLLSEQVSNTVWPKYTLSHSLSYAN